MRYKVAPEPASYDRLVAVRDALPLVPGSVDDCCARIRDRTAVATRDDAREWLTFLTALDVAAETDRGFHRVRETPDREALGEAFLSDVFGARELLDCLEGADGPLSADAVFEEVRDAIPRWERDRHVDWEAEWLARVETLLAWGAVFGVFESRDRGYVPPHR